MRRRDGFALRAGADQDCFASKRVPLVFVHGIYENDSGDIFGVGESEVANYRAAEGVPHENKRSMLTQFFEGVSQLQIYLGQGARHRPRIAPGVSGTIVSADASKPRNLGLNEYPVKRKVAESILHNDSGTAFSRAIHVKVVATQVDEPSRRAGLRLGERRTGGCRCQNQCADEY